MPNTKKRKGSSRVHSRAQERTRISGSAQSKVSQQSDSIAVVQKNDRPQRRKRVSPSFSTSGFNTSGLKFKSRLGFEILKQYGATIEFSRSEKIRALKLYNCLKHLPEFDNKQFDNSTDAVCHMIKEASRLLTHRYGFISNDTYGDEDVILEEYGIQIIYEEFDPTDGRWGSYCDINACTEHDKELRRVFYMCMKLIFGFGFTCFDNEGDSSIQSFENWSEWKMERALEELSDLRSQFETENSREYDSNLDADTDIGYQIESVLEDIDDIQAVIELRQTVALPIIQRIYRTRVNFKLMQRVADKYKNSDPGKWISHILILHKKDFHIEQYTANAYRDMDPCYDQESVDPKSSYGFVFDGDDLYSKDMCEDYNEYVGNFCVVPFAINKVIMNNGYIYQTPDVPLGAWIKGIFNFSFTTYKNEINRQSSAKSLIDTLL